MYGALTRSSVHYIISLVLTRGLYFLMLPVLTAYLDPAAYGLFDLITIMGSLVLVVASLEISQALGRFVPEVRDDPDESRAYASTAFVAVVVGYMIFAVLTLAFADPLARWLLGDSEQAHLIRLAVLSYAALAFLYVQQAVLRGQLRSADYTRLSVLSAVVTLGAMLVVLIVLEGGVVHLLIAQTLGAVTGLTYGAWLTHRTITFRFDAARYREMLLFSLPFVPSTLGVLATQYIDRLAISDLMSLSDVGIYSVASRIALLVTLAMLGVQSALSPLIYSRFKDPETPGQIATIFRVTLVGGLMLYLLIGFNARHLVVLFSSPAFLNAAAVLPLLALAAFMRVAYIFTPGLDIAKRTGLIAVLNIGSAVLNTVLNYLLIPVWGLEGAALATLLSALALIFGYALLSQREYPVPHKWGAAILCTALTITWMFFWPRLPSGGGAIFYVGGAFASLLTACHFTGLLRIAEARQFARAVTKRG